MAGKKEKQGPLAFKDKWSEGSSSWYRTPGLGIPTWASWETQRAVGSRDSTFFFFFNLFIYLFLAVLGLRFCARAFSGCGKRGPLFIVVRGPLTIAASLVAGHRLQTRRLSSCGSRA